MPKKRSHGEGNIYFYERVNRWCAQITLDNGKRVTKYFPTQKEAHAWPLEARNAQQLGREAMLPTQLGPAFPTRQEFQYHLGFELR